MRLPRRRFLHALTAAAASPWLASGCEGELVAPRDRGARAPSSGRMPVLFVGHGSPMNAIEDNAWSRGFRALARLLPPAKTIVVVSAHWAAPGSFVTNN